jgi:hypothetical protein
MVGGGRRRLPDAQLQALLLELELGDLLLFEDLQDLLQLVEVQGGLPQEGENRIIPARFREVSSK